MFKKLQKKLTFLYTLTTGTILTVILIICFFYMKTAVEARYKAEFSDIFLTISNRFQTESFFTDSWLAQMESDNHLLIHIEETENLYFSGSIFPGYETGRPAGKCPEKGDGYGDHFAGGYFFFSPADHPLSP